MFPSCTAIFVVQNQKQNMSEFYFKHYLINIVQSPHINTLIELTFKLTIDLSFNKGKILGMQIKQTVPWAKQNYIRVEINKF